MDILIRGEFTDNGHPVTINTIGDREPIDYRDIIGVDNCYFRNYEDKGGFFEIKYELFEAYLKQKEYDKEYNKLHYDQKIDISFAKPFLYKHFIEDYGIIDNLTEVVIKNGLIYVKYKIDDKISEKKFDYGYDLLREYKIYKCKKNKIF